MTMELNPGGRYFDILGGNGIDSKYKGLYCALAGLHPVLIYFGP